MTHFCRHYPSMGIAFNDICNAGVEMITTADKSQGAIGRLPCFNPAIKHRCAKHESYTAEEIAERERAIADVMRRLDAAAGWTLVGTTCPHCGKGIDRMEQVGECVYARPCGCRQYQGAAPEA